MFRRRPTTFRAVRPASTLERLTLPPGSALPPQEAQPWVWTEVGSGVLGLRLEGDKLPFRWKSGAERMFRHGQYLPALPPGTRMTFRTMPGTTRSSSTASRSCRVLG